MDKKQWFTKHSNLSPDEVSATVAWRIIVARSWSDAAFKARLLAEPQAVLAEYGVPVPAGVTLKIVEDTPGVKNLILPAKEAEVTVVDTGFDPDPGF